MSRAVSGRSSAIRKATSESWRISLSVSWLIPPCRAYRSAGGLRHSPAATSPGESGRHGRTLEMLVGWAVVPLRQRRTLARLALPRRRMAVGGSPLEGPRLDLLVDELDRRLDAVGHGPGDLGLHGDREVPPDVLEQRPVGPCEVVGIRCQPLHRAFAGREHLAPIAELGVPVDVRIDQILDRSIDRSRVLI